MLSRVARVLLGSEAVGRILILAQESEALLDHPDTRWIRNEARISLEPSEVSISAGVWSLLRRHPNSYPFLITTADNVLLDERTIGAMVDAAAGADVAAGLVERRTLLAAYPESERTWLPFRNESFSGANLFWIGSPEARPLIALWQGIEQSRKRRWRVVGAFGPLLLLAAVLRLLTLRQAFDRIGRRYKLKITPVVLPFPEACIDVDKPGDHALVTAILERRAAEGAA